MRIYSEKHLSDFTPWGGAKNTLGELTFGQINELNDILEELYSDSIEETDLNDLLWFEQDTIAEWLGFADWETLKRANNGEEETEEDEEE